MSEHDPLCPYSQHCPVEWRNDDWRRETGEVTPHRIVSGSSGRCVECDAGDCVCEIIRQARQEGRESIAQMWDADKDTMPGRIIEAFDRGVAEEKRRIRAEVVDYYKVAPKAGETILRIIDGSET